MEEKTYSLELTEKELRLLRFACRIADEEYREMGMEAKAFDFLCLVEKLKME